jgi:hypothetical protein
VWCDAIAGLVVAGGVLVASRPTLELRTRAAQDSTETRVADSRAVIAHMTLKTLLRMFEHARG